MSATRTDTANLDLAADLAAVAGAGDVPLAAEGETRLPVDGYMPLSKVVGMAQAIEACADEHRARMERHGIRACCPTCFSGTECVIEPAFAERWNDIPADPEKRRVALALRDGLRDLYDAHGCCHLRIGKYYSYQDMIENEALRKLLRAVKGVLDPARQVNPGALGL